MPASYLTAKAAKMTYENRKSVSSDMIESYRYAHPNTRLTDKEIEKLLKKKK